MGKQKGDVKTALPNLLNVGPNPATAGFNRDPVIEQICVGKQWLRMPPPIKVIWESETVSATPEGRGLP